MQAESRRGQPSETQDMVERVVADLLAESDPLRRYEALTKAQLVYDAISGRLAAERARSVAEMHGSGLSYAQIAGVLGFTRARAQQLVERAPTGEGSTPRWQIGPAATEAKITQYLWQEAPRLLAENTTAREIAARLFADASFRALQLGTLLNTPKPSAVAAAVGGIRPSLPADQSALLVDAVTLAAKMQQDEGRERAIAAGLLLAVGGGTPRVGKKLSRAHGSATQEKDGI
jgi:hypothetical protein